MKTNLRLRVVLLFLGIVVQTVFGTTGSTVKGPVIEVSGDQLSLGVLVLRDEPYKAEIVFRNTGDQPLILFDVKACCATTVLDWPREPVAPAGEGSIHIQFGIEPGTRTVIRTVVITANTAQGRHVFRMKGDMAADGESK